MEEGESRLSIDSPREPKSPGALRTYPCQEIFDEAIEWLRDHGVKGYKPIHALPKEIGAEITSERKIYATKDYLGHATIGMSMWNSRDTRICLIKRRQTII